MRLQLFIYSLPVLLVLSCADGRQTKPSVNTDSKKNEVKSKPPATYQDTLTITDSAAVFYNPDSLQLEKIKLVTDAGAFESKMHEFYFLRKTAKAIITQHFSWLKMIEAKNVRYLLFV